MEQRTIIVTLAISLPVQIPDGADSEILEVRFADEATADATIEEEQEDQPEESPEVFVCEACGREFQSKKGLGRHRASCAKEEGGSEGSGDLADEAGPFSHCCKAGVREGPKHANGTNYCTQCDQPCFRHTRR
jgi:hypothetical protein